MCLRLYNVKKSWRDDNFESVVFSRRAKHETWNLHSALQSTRHGICIAARPSYTLPVVPRLGRPWPWETSTMLWHTLWRRRGRGLRLAAVLGVLAATDAVQPLPTTMPTAQTYGELRQLIIANVHHRKRAAARTLAEAVWPD